MFFEDNIRFPISCFECIKAHIGVVWPMFYKLWHKGCHYESSDWNVQQGTKWKCVPGSSESFYFYFILLLLSVKFFIKLKQKYNWSFLNQASSKEVGRLLGKQVTWRLCGGNNLASVWVAMLASRGTQQKIQERNLEAYS